MKLTSIRVRLTVLFVFIFGSTLIGISTAGYQFFMRVQRDDFDASLFNHAIDVASAIDRDIIGRLTIHPLTPKELTKLQPERSFMQIRRSDGTVIVRSTHLGDFELPLSPRDLVEVVQTGYKFDTLPRTAFSATSTRVNSSYRLISYSIVRPDIPPLILQLAAPLTYIERVNADLLRFLLIGIPAILIIATLSGLYMTRRALQPVAAMVSTAERIGVGQLSQRIPVPQTDDELKHLAVTLNNLLERVERSVLANETFVSNASHQIKTPLAILKGELELTLSRQRSAEDIHSVLKSATQEINSLTTLIENLLVLARVDAGVQSLQKTEERFDELIMEVVARLEPLTRKKRLHLKLSLESNQGYDVTPNFDILGDSDLLKTMLQSLIENAIKYSPEGGGVSVVARDEGQTVTVTITDEGPGIDKEDAPHVFDRFYRSRKKDAEVQGFGLGLPIALRIAELHGGDITINNTQSGASLTAVVRRKS